ncbi:uncharacterized protein LOC143578443 [Bidens hawaiensis]|uniref:uncharacterized protein LOC143578443 n=1 Tax=Bidens hawaiensis TaxID=980011 RepID=UPI0040495F82
MAYRRRQGLSRSSTFKEGVRYPSDNDDATTSSAAIPHTSSDSRLDSFRSGAFHSSFKNRSKGSGSFDYASVRSSSERGGFWGVLARKAKAILDDDIPQQSNAHSSVKPIGFSISSQVIVDFLHSNHSLNYKYESGTLSAVLCKRTGNIQIQNQNESFGDLKKMESPALRIGMDRLTPSLNQISVSIGNSLENRTVIGNEEKNQDPRRVIKNEEKNQGPKIQLAQPQKNPETLLQTSRDVAIATAAKVKQLMRELKTVKSELAFAEERCCQLEEENKLLLGPHEKGEHPADDDLIRDQLETLLAEKGRLAHDNSVYALENRHLREIVDFHQLTMQDLIYYDEGVIEVTLPETPEAYHHMVEASSSGSSRFLVEEEEQ